MLASHHSSPPSLPPHSAMKTLRCALTCAALWTGFNSALIGQDAELTLVRCRVVDATTGGTMPARVYVQAESGGWNFVNSAGGTSVRYNKSRADNSRSVEIHTTVSAHPFAVELKPGKYTFTVERGKEYHSETREVTVGNEPLEITI